MQNPGNNFQFQNDQFHDFESIQEELGRFKTERFENQLKSAQKDKAFLYLLLNQSLDEKEYKRLLELDKLQLFVLDASIKSPFRRKYFTYLTGNTGILKSSEHRIFRAIMQYNYIIGDKQQSIRFLESFKEHFKNTNPNIQFDADLFSKGLLKTSRLCFAIRNKEIENPRVEIRKWDTIGHMTRLAAFYAVNQHSEIEEFFKTYVSSENHHWFKDVNHKEGKKVFFLNKALHMSECLSLEKWDYNTKLVELLAEPAPESFLLALNLIKITDEDVLTETKKYKLIIKRIDDTTTVDYTYNKRAFKEKVSARVLNVLFFKAITSRTEVKEKIHQLFETGLENNIFDNEDAKLVNRAFDHELFKSKEK